MPRPLLDTAQPDLMHIDQRLAREPVAWLGTTRPNGRPHNIPIWFLWRDPEILLFTPRRSQKVKNLAASAAGVVTLDSADGGNDIVIVEGRARPVDDADVEPLAVGFVEKYTPRMTETFAEWRANFDQAVLFTADRILAWSKPGGELRFRLVTPE